MEHLIQNSCTGSKPNTFQMYVQNVTIIPRYQKIKLANLFHKNWIHEVVQARAIMYSPKCRKRNSFSFTSLNMACHVMIFHKLKRVLHMYFPANWRLRREGGEVALYLGQYNTSLLACLFFFSQRSIKINL